MSIIESAKIELAAAHFGEEDSRVMVEILEQFFGQWDSGGAVSCVAPVLMRLISGQPLSPLTGKNEEWMEVGDGVFQNIRCSSVFKERDARHYNKASMQAYDLDRDSWDGSFPYDPTSKLPEFPIYGLSIEVDSDLAEKLR